MEVFGPVPSRRFGQSIGVNHIPPKICTYACRYCQLGKAIRMQTERESFYAPEDLIREVKHRVDSVSSLDYITLVPDGEPTLDKHLDEIISGLKALKIPIAVITNASMLWDENVRKELALADCVSVKVDAVSEDTWRLVDRPHRQLQFDKVLKGVQQFAQEYSGRLITESMLVSGMNDTGEELQGIANFIATLNPEIAYISIPTRPPADNRVKPASEEALQKAYVMFSEKTKQVELLIGYEGNAFSASGDAESDLLSITAVHPMREDAVLELLQKDNADETLLQSLVDQQKILKLDYQGHSFYLRKLRQD